MRDERARALAQRWLSKAFRDLDLARYALKLEYSEEAAFHIQQAMEKSLKAMLIVRSIVPPRTHDLTELGKLLGVDTRIPSQLQREATTWAVQARYVDEQSIPPQTAVIEAALVAAVSVYEQAKADVG